MGENGDDPDPDTYILLQHLPTHQQEEVGEKDLASIIERLEGLVGDPDLQWNHVVRTRRDLQNYFELQLRFTVADKARVVELLWKLFTHDNIPFTYQAKIANTLTAILKEKVPGLCRNHPFSWKVLRDIITTVHLRNSQEGELPLGGSQVLRFHENALINLVKAVRWYLDYDAVMPELVETYSPLFDNALSKDIFLGQTMIELFAPPPHVRESGRRFDNQALVEKIVKSWWPLVSYCTEWDQIWCSLLRRLGKYDLSIRWDPYLPFLFQKIQDALRISIGGRKPDGCSFRFRPSRLFHTLNQPEVRNIAKFAVMLVGSGSAKDYYAYPGALELSGLLMGEQEQVAADAADVEGEIRRCSEDAEGLSAGFLYLRRFMCAVSTLFHPSNQGRNSYTLAAFLNFLCSGFVKRLGRGVRPMKARDKTEFLRLVLPLTKMCLTAKNEVIVLMAQSALRHLAWVAPHTVLNEMEPFLLQALDPHNLNQTHMAPAAMKALDILIQPFLHARLLLPSLLPKLLHLTLPGIDPNDASKTIVTLRLYDTILQWIPVVDTSQFNAGDKPSDEILALCHPSTDSREFELDAPAVKGEKEELKEARDSMWSSGPGLAAWALEALERVLYLFRSIGERSKNNKTGFSMEGTKIYQVDLFFRSLFVQMDPLTKRRAENTVKQWVLDNCYVNALKELKALMRACFLASDDRPALLKALIDALQPRVRHTFSKMQLLWALTILGAVARVAGADLLPHKQVLVEIIDKCIANDDKAVRGLAMKLLRRSLKGLCDVYELSTASVEKARIAEEGWAQISVRWGYTPGWAHIAPAYHIPSEEEKAAAEELKGVYLSRPMGAMEEKMLKSDKSSVEWRTHLSTVFHLLRGVSFTLAESERRELMVRMCGIVEWVLTKHESDTQTHRKALKVLKILALCRGGKFHADRSDPGYYQGFFTRLTQSSALGARVLEANRRKPGGNSEQNHGLLVFSRCAMRQSVQTLSQRQTQQHIFDSANANREVPAYIKVLEVLLKASVHEWTESRKAAQRIFRAVSLRFPRFMKRKTSACLELLVVKGMEESPGLADAQLTGAIYLVSHKNILRWIVTSWDLLDKFMRKAVMEADVSALSSEKQNSAHVRMQKVLLAVFHAWNTIPLWNNDNMRTWRALVADLSSMPFKACSWRKQLGISGCLTILIRQDVETPEKMWRWFITGVKSSSIPVQVTCAFALAKLLMVNNTDFDLNVLKPELLHPDFLDTLLRVISENRRVVPSADGTSTTSAKWSLGVADIMSLGKVRKSSGWYPQNRTKTESKTFNFSHAHITLQFTLRFKADFLRPVLPILQKAIVHKFGTSDHENHLVGGAEAVAGILLARAKLQDAEVDAIVQKEVIPMVLDSLNQQSLSFATSWMGAARYCSTYRVDQGTFLHAAIANVQAQLEAQAHATSRSFTSVINSIRLLRVLFVEADETQADFVGIKDRIEAILIPAFRHPFKTVRHEVGDTVAAVIDKLISCLRDYDASKRLIKQMLAACWSKAALGETQGEKDSKHSEDPEDNTMVTSGNEELVKAEEVDLLAAETALATLTKLVQMGGYDEYCVELLPVVIHASHTSDLELNKVAKAVAGRVALNLETRGGEAIAILNHEGLSAQSWLLRFIAVSMQDVILTRQAVMLGIVRTMHVRKTLERMLFDDKAEVHKAAMMAMLNVLTAVPPGSHHISSMISKFIALTKLPETEGAEESKKRHVGVLGLSALVGAFPYSVPFTDPIVRLAVMSGRTDAAGRDAKLAVEEFKRTHHDTWEVDKLKFSAMELEDLEYSYSGREGYA